MSENIKFIQKIKPVYVDATGREIRAPFLSVPFTETVYRVSAGINTGLFNALDLNALYTATEELYITRIVIRASDTNGNDFSRELTDGFWLYLYYTLGAVNYSIFNKTYALSENPCVLDGLGRYYWSNTHVCYPPIKCTYSRTATAGRIYNYTQQNISDVIVDIYYFILPYAT